MNPSSEFDSTRTAFHQVLRWALAALGSMLTLSATAQPAWPGAKSITIIVPYSAGGSLDNTTRLVAQRLSERLGQAVVIDNATGAGGAVGIGKAIQAAPDGYTFLMAGDSPFKTDVTQAQIKAGASPYRQDMLKELTPVVLVNTAPMLLVAHPSVAANDLNELVAYSKKNPGRLNYASSGIGTLPHLATEMIKHEAGIHMVHIPYRGGAQIANDVAGKQVDLAMMISASALPHIQSKVIKALAVTGETRLPALPNVPTVAESANQAARKGLKNFAVVSWAGLYAPHKTPEAIVQRMAQEVSEVLKMDAVRHKLSEQAAQAKGGTPQAFSQFIERDRAQLRQVLQHTSLQE